MTWLKAAAAMIAGVAALLTATAAWAYCETYPSVAEELAEAEFAGLVFVSGARVVRAADDPEGFAGVFYTLEPLVAFKGAKTPAFEVFSENTTGRFPMSVTGVYMVFVPPAHESWTDGVAGPMRTINSCGVSFAVTGISLAFGPEAPQGDLPSIMARSPEISELVERAEGCGHFAGEEPYDDARRAQIEAAVADLRCSSLSREAAFTRPRFEGSPEAQARLDRALEGWTT